MKTPTLDKHKLHPIGGYCTCHFGRCSICDAITAQQERWAALSPEELIQANKEYDEAYPKVRDAQTGGR